MYYNYIRLSKSRQGGRKKDNRKGERKMTTNEYKAGGNYFTVIKKLATN